MHAGRVPLTTCVANSNFASDYDLKSSKCGEGTNER